MSVEDKRTEIEAAEVEAGDRALAIYKKQKEEGAYVEAAKTLLENRYAIARARSRAEAAAPAAPTASPPTPERARFEELKKSDPVNAARYLLANRALIFPKGAS